MRSQSSLQSCSGTRPRFGSTPVSERERNVAEEVCELTLETCRRDYLSNRPIAIDFFSGVGGLSLGLEAAGFGIAAHVEIDETASRYAQFNFPLTASFGGERGDVRGISANALLNTVPNGQEVSLIAGGPPCQGFSVAGRKNPDDPLNDLVLEMTRLILDVRPKAFLIENVPGIKRGQIWQLDEAIDQLAAHYRVSSPATLYAPDFGVPQIRKRVFVLGIRTDLQRTPRHPKASHVVPTHEPLLLSPLPITPTVAEAISDLPDVSMFPHLVNGDEVAYATAPQNSYQSFMRSEEAWAQLRGYGVKWDSAVCTNCRSTQHGPALESRLRQLKEGQADSSSGIRKLEARGLSTTIRAGTTEERGSWSAPRPCHYAYPRVITSRECARLQSFPDWFRFHPVKWHGNRQIGNAVPPLLAKAVGSELLAVLGLRCVATKAPVKLERETAMIAEDIERARAAGFDKKRVSHQVIGTRLGAPKARGRSSAGNI